MRKLFARPLLEALEDRLAPAVFNVPADVSSLAGAIAKVGASTDSDNTIILASGTFTSINQQITVSAGQSLTILGQGQGSTILTANGQGRVLEVSGDVVLEDLSITGGLLKGTAGGADLRGGGVLIDGGQVTLSNVAVAGNALQGAAGPAGVGGIGNAGAGQNALGGGIFLADGNLVLNAVTLGNNHVLGGNGGIGSTRTIGAPGGAGGTAAGGGLYVAQGAVSGSNDIIANNVVLGGTGGQGGRGHHSNSRTLDTILNGAGGSGGAGGAAKGGGIYLQTGSVLLFGADVAANQASGGKGGMGGHGAPPKKGNTYAPGSISGLPGFAGTGGVAAGGGIFAGAGSLALVAAVCNGDVARGGTGGAPGARRAGAGTDYVTGRGGTGGSGFGGGLYDKSAMVNLFGGVVAHCSAIGGAGATGIADVAPGDRVIRGGGYGGTGGGGGLYVAAGAVSLIQLTGLTYDVAVGGHGGPDRRASADGGNGGDGQGGACCVFSGILNIDATPFSLDTAQGGDGYRGTDAVNATPSFVEGDDGGTGGSGGAGEGGAICNLGGNVYDYGGSISGAVIGGKGATGGNGGNGSVNTQRKQVGDGGNSTGGAGGAAEGAAVFEATGTTVLDGVTIAGKSQPGAGGLAGTPGRPGGPSGFPGRATNGAPGATGHAYDGPAYATTGPAATQLVYSPVPPEVNARTPLPYPVYVVAEDAAGDLAGDYHSAVTANLLPLTLGSLSVNAWDQNDAGYAGTIQVQGGTTPYQLSIQDLPAGLSDAFDPNSGLLTITGTPTQVGSGSILVTVTDPTGARVTQSYPVTINPPLALGSLSTTEWTQDQAGYVGTIQVSGGTLPYSYPNISGLPFGLGVAAFDPTAGTITITGTPSGGLFVPPGGIGGIGGIGGPGGGSNQTQPVTYTVNVSVSDNVGATVTDTYSLVIDPPSAAPALSKPGSSALTGTPLTSAPLALGTLSAPVWTQNDPGYSGTIQVSGGTGPYQASVQGLPSGLIESLDPESGLLTITGTPTTTATGGTIVVSVTDTAHDNVTQAYPLTINAPLAVGPLSTTEWTMNKPGYQGTIQIDGGTLPYGSPKVSGLPTGLTVSSFDATTGLITITGTPTPPGAVASSQPLSYTIGVSIRDNVGATATGALSLLIDPPVLTGTLTIQAVHGVAVFSDLSINERGDGYTLTATSSDQLPATPTNRFNVGGSITVTTTVNAAGTAIDYTSIAAGLGPNVKYQVALYASPDEQFHASDPLLTTQNVQGTAVHGVFQLATGPASRNDINPDDPYLLVVADPSALLPAAPAVARAVSPADQPEPPGPSELDTSHLVEPAAISTDFAAQTDPDDPIGMLGPPNYSVAYSDTAWQNVIDRGVVPTWQAVTDTTVTVFQAGKNLFTNDVPFLCSVFYAAVGEAQATKQFADYTNTPYKGVASLPFVKAVMKEAVAKTEQLGYAAAQGVQNTPIQAYPGILCQGLLNVFQVPAQGVQWLADNPLVANDEKIDSVADKINTPKGFFDYVVAPLALYTIQEISMNVLARGFTLLKSAVPASQLAATFCSQLAAVMPAVYQAALSVTATSEPFLLAQLSAMKALQKLQNLEATFVTSNNILAQALLASYDAAQGAFTNASLVLQELANAQLTRSFKRLVVKGVDYALNLINARQKLLYDPANALTIAAVQKDEAFTAWAARKGLDTPAWKEGNLYNLEVGTISTPGAAPSLGADRDAVLYVVNKVSGQKIEVLTQYWQDQAYSDFHAVGLKALGVQPGQPLPGNLQQLYQAWQGWLQESTSLTNAQIQDRAFANLFNQLFTDAYDVEASRAFSNQLSWAFDPGIATEIGLPVPLQLDISNIQLVQAGRALLQDPYGFIQMWRSKVEFYFNAARTGEVTLADRTVVDLSILNETYLPEAIAQAQKGCTAITAVRNGYRIIQKELGAQVSGFIPPLPPSVVKAMSIIAQAPVGVDATATAMASFNAQLQAIGFSDLGQAWEAITQQISFLKAKKV